MKKTFKKVLSVLLSLLMLLPMFGSLSHLRASAYAVGDTIRFGNYPQSQVTDASLISALESTAKTWRSYRYYYGTGTTGGSSNGQMQPGDFMQFADFFYGGNKYRGVHITQNRPTETGFVPSASNSVQATNGYSEGSTYYFKYEPLNWRVLDPSTGLVICTTIIDAQPYQSVLYCADGNTFYGKYYQSTACETWGNSYATTTVRSWLNYDFYETAFSDAQKANVKTTHLNNDAANATYNSPATDDKVFFLSTAESNNSAYNLSPKANPGFTAYSKCQGLNNQEWLLRTPGWNGQFCCAVGTDGNSGDGAWVYHQWGVRPAVCLNTIAENGAQSMYLFSADAYHTHDGTTVLMNEKPASCVDGYTGDLCCSVCGTVLSAGSSIPAIGEHVYTDPVWTWTQGLSAATAVFTCIGCGRTESRTDSAPAAGASGFTATVEFRGGTYTDTAYFAVGDTFTFGSYPQTRVTNSALISSLEAQEKDWASYKYYSGTGNPDGNMQPFDGVLFADFWFEGVKYRALKIEQYRPWYTFYTSSAGNSDQYNRGYYAGTVYYFKYEPLTWRVLDPATGFVISEKLIDAQPLQSVIYYNGGNYYQDAGSAVYANNYASSTLRSWLNREFYETAFTDSQKADILTRAYGNEFPSSTYNYPAVNDKISLATQADVTNVAYGFSNDAARAAVTTDYAKSQGVHSSDQWRLRSPGSTSRGADWVNGGGALSSNSDVFYASSGIRPVCHLSFIHMDPAVDEDSFSHDLHAEQGHSFATVWTWASDYSSATFAKTCPVCSLVFSSATDNAPVLTLVTPENCAADRVVKYTATVTLDGETFTGETAGISVPGTATGLHVYGEPTWTWRQDRSSASAVFTCINCGHSETRTDNAPVENDDSYTATVTFMDEIYTSTVSFLVGDVIRYGSYPQTRVTSAVQISELEAAPKVWASYEYYSGTGPWDGNMKPGDWMRYADFWYNGEKYRAVEINAYRPAQTQNGTSTSSGRQKDSGYTLGTYYFKYEPLVWRVLDVDTGLVVCDKLIDSQPVQNVAYEFNTNDYRQGSTEPGLNYYANSFATCTLRDWLNFDFYETAFTEEQKTNINTTTVENDAQTATYASGNTEDKIFLLSQSQISNSAYGFSSNASRQAYGTAYAFSQGLEASGTNPARYWLRTASDTVRSRSTFFVQQSGSLNGNSWTTDTYAGIRPACCLNVIKADAEISETTFSAPVAVTYQPGEIGGENVSAQCAWRYQLPSGNDVFEAPEGLVCSGWVRQYDGLTYAPGETVVLTGEETFTAQWAQGFTVTFITYGGSEIAAQHLLPNTNAIRPNDPVKDGMQFMGWRLDDSYYDFSAPVTENITLYAVWTERFTMEESFENGMPEGWTTTVGNNSYQWTVGVGDYSTGTGAHSGSHNFKITHRTTNAEAWLITPVWDFSTQVGVTIDLWYINRSWSGDIDKFGVYYRVDAGAWKQLSYTSAAHASWTNLTLSLPAEALTSGVQIGFYAKDGYGYGIGLDDVVIIGSQHHQLSYSAADNVLTAVCSNDPCSLEDNTLTLTLNAPAKTVYGDENSESATLTDLGRFNVELCLAISEDDIEYYKGETLLDAAPVNAGNYTAKLTVTVDGTDYSIEKAYSIAKATPTPELPTGITATYGDTLADVALPAGWTWDDELTTPVGNAGDNVFAATFTPEDTDNYETVTETFTVAVDKATPTPEIPAGLTALYGSTLADVELPAGWAWVDPATPVGCLGDHTFSATFTPEDTDNYNTVTETLTVNVYTNYTFVPAKAPTCTRAGNTAYYNDRNRHYYVVNEANELVEIELYTTVIPAPGHTYGTEGDARFTCTVCGYVDPQRKADAEYEDMLPYYLDEFNRCKQEVKAMCDSRAMDGDSAACAALIAKAKSDIDGLAWERSKTLEQNKSAVTAILNRLNGELAQQRAADRAGACPYCGANHNGSFIGIFHVFLYKLEKFFSTLFGMGR